MTVYKIQIISLYHNRTIKKNRAKKKTKCCHANRKDDEMDHKDVKTTYVSIKYLLKTATRKNKVLARHE